jgi:hypothetical protein
MDMPKKHLVAEALIDLHRRLSTLATRSHERRMIMQETAITRRKSFLPRPAFLRRLAAPWIEHGIRGFRATGSVLGLPSHPARKAEALHLANRTTEALEAINEAEALAQRFEQHYWSAELRRLRGVFLTAMGADETQIEASFRKAITIAREQKSVSLEKRAEATYAEYRRQKASGSEGRGFRLPL